MFEYGVKADVESQQVPVLTINHKRGVRAGG